MLAPNSLLAQAVICLLNLHLLAVSLPSTQHRLKFESYQTCVLQRSQRYLAFIGPTSAVEDVWADRLEQTLRDSMDSCCHESGKQDVRSVSFVFICVYRKNSRKSGHGGSGLSSQHLGGRNRRIFMC